MGMRMRRVIIVLFTLTALAACAVAQEHPWLEKQDSATRAMLEMYGATEEYLAMQDQMDEIMEQSEQAERRERNARLIIIGVSLLAAVWTFVSGIRTFRQAEGKTRGGVILAIGVLLLGCAGIFAFNYGVLLFRHKTPDAFNLLMSFGIVIALLVLAVVMLKKNKDSRDKPGNDDF